MASHVKEELLKLFHLVHGKANRAAPPTAATQVRPVPSPNLTGAQRPGFMPQALNANGVRSQVASPAIAPTASLDRMGSIDGDSTPPEFNGDIDIPSLVRVQDGVPVFHTPKGQILPYPNLSQVMSQLRAQIAKPDVNQVTLKKQLSERIMALYGVNLTQFVTVFSTMQALVNNLTTLQSGVQAPNQLASSAIQASALPVTPVSAPGKPAPEPAPTQQKVATARGKKAAAATTTAASVALPASPALADAVPPADGAAAGRAAHGTPILASAKVALATNEPRPPSVMVIPPRGPVDETALRLSVRRDLALLYGVQAVRREPSLLVSRRAFLPLRRFGGDETSRLVPSGSDISANASDDDDDDYLIIFGVERPGSKRSTGATKRKRADTDDATNIAAADGDSNTDLAADTPARDDTAATPEFAAADGDGDATWPRRRPRLETSGDSAAEDTDGPALPALLPAALAADLGLQLDVRHMGRVAIVTATRAADGFQLMATAVAPNAAAAAAAAAPAGLRFRAWVQCEGSLAGSRARLAKALAAGPAAEPPAPASVEEVVQLLFSV
ncbi:hypothetical protein HK405_005793 [Cladochytrium tenue]|nr:hypothetical protein HK405_005793 [Cladochytrium tenue]